MRDLIFKNLTSSDKKRRIIASSEIIDKQGIRSIIRRHFACIVKEVESDQVDRPSAYLYILKVRDTKERKQKFFCRIKGSVCAVSNGKLFLIRYMHSLKVDLTAVPLNSLKNSLTGQ